MLLKFNRHSFEKLKIALKYEAGVEVHLEVKSYKIKSLKPIGGVVR